MVILSENPRPKVIPNRLEDGKLLTSIYEKLTIKALRKAKKLAIISALVIASHKKTAAKGKTSIRAKKLNHPLTPSRSLIDFEDVVNSNLYFSSGFAYLKHPLAASAPS